MLLIPVPCTTSDNQKKEKGKKKERKKGERDYSEDKVELVKHVYSLLIHNM